MFTCPIWWPAKVLATNPTTQLPGRLHPTAKFHYSSWQEHSPHPQSGLNKRPSDITSCRLQNSPDLPTSDHKVPGHAGPSGQGRPARGTLHTLKQQKQKPQSRKAPTTTSARRPGPSLLAPFVRRTRASCPSASPCPSANPMEPWPRPACGQAPARPGHPTTHIASRAPDTKP